MADKRFTGQIERIEFATDPWLEVAGTREPVDLTEFDASQFPAGIFAPVNTDYGIERDDEADIFEGDFEAATALAEWLHGLTGLEYEVWFEPESDEPRED